MSVEVAGKNGIYNVPPILKGKEMFNAETTLRYTKEEKLAFLQMSLEEKIQRTKELILEWYLQFDGKVYVAFSGGKDSTVLLHIARSIKRCKDIKGVFSDTGLEYPEIRDFVKKQENIVWIKPKLTFKQVVEKYGWPVISKEQSSYVYEYRNTKSEKLRNIRLNGKDLKDGRYSKSFKISEKWKPILESDFKISDFCCDVMKKKPFSDFERQTGMKRIVGVMAEESALRLEMFLKGNCNEFNKAHPVSKPLSFWTEQDIYEYIKRNDLEIASVYGDIVKDENGKWKTTGAHRTGCMFCMYGLHLESHPNRFERMKETHPKQYEYIMDKLNGRHVMETYLACDKKKGTEDK